MKRQFCSIPLIVVTLLASLGSGCAPQPSSTNQASKPTTIRVGYFPNLTHAPALIGLARGTFVEMLGAGAIVDTKMFNAGPSEVEALFAGEIDIGYIGPSPAVNGYLRSQGQALRIVSGVTSGGASLVLQPDLASVFVTDGANALRGKKIATPQQGNTQDVALRHYLSQNSLKGSVTVVPIANADQTTAFSQKQIDGSWAPEPWASRLVAEGKGVRVFDERTQWADGAFATTNIIVRTAFLNEHPDVVRAWIAANATTIAWMNEHPADARKVVNDELERLTKKRLSDEVLNDAWSHLNFTTDPVASSTLVVAGWAKDEQLLPVSDLDLTQMFDLQFIPNAQVGKNP